ncbi:lamin tail domain-containing protein [Roseimarinus sediminis]|uniref:lamin tail domain-containing protein n=1 Tax=Roseimarinus sediminis TaxID=1610899 RepID=UPI003D2205EB
MFTLASSGQTLQVRINELMASNSSIIQDADGDFSDWIELYNPEGESLELEGWYLTDDRNQLHQWKLPEISIKAHDFLLIFASGKDRSMAGSELHTNFKLNASGEYLALVDPDGTIVNEFYPAFPEQKSDISYGYYDGVYQLLAVPTPGGDNKEGEVLVPDPIFSTKHGVFDEPFMLEIQALVEDAKVFYTLNGNTPSVEDALLYTSPIPVDSTTIVRAVAVVNGNNSSRVITQSYIFPRDVIHQGNTPAGYPVNWGSYSGISGTAVADYEMDPEMMSDPVFAASVIEGLKSLPVMSLVADIDYLFSHSSDPDSGGIYIYTGAPVGSGIGKGWERPASMEYIPLGESESIQLNCGIRLHGGHSRLPEKSPKHSFRLVFRNEYGTSKLQYPLFDDEDATTSFNSLVLRAGFGLSWIHHSHGERKLAQYQRDIWIKDTQRAIGHVSSRSSYVHLFINGIYWGIYAPSERMDSDFAASYLKGEPEDFDVIKDYQDVANGTIENWNKLMNVVNSGVVDDVNYQRIQGNNPDGTYNPEYENLVDVVNLADYMLLNFYGGNTDWDHHNWAAAKNRNNPLQGFNFFCWDAEHILKSVDQNVLNENNDQCPSRIFQQLRKNETFVRLFSDRVQHHCFNGGVLTPEAALQRWNNRTLQVEKALTAESARWGDYRRDVHPYQTSGPFDLYSYTDHWLTQRDFMLSTYFPERTQVLLDQLRSAGLYPSIEAPEFFINKQPFSPENNIDKGDVLSMKSAEGVIYYTTNGQDPAKWEQQDDHSETSLATGDQLNSSITNGAQMYSEPISLTTTACIKARTYSNGSWSAMMSGSFIFADDFEDIKVTEVHYNPLADGVVDGKDLEFIELKNTGSSTLDMGGASFTDGVEFVFPSETLLPADSFVVLASNWEHFYERYGFLPDGEYSGNLNNGGEQLLLESNAGDTIFNLTYGNNSPWPLDADGTGYSLVPVDINPIGNQKDYSDWRASFHLGGSPGKDDKASFNKIVDFQEKKSFTLSQNYPNPFYEVTYINYELAEKAWVDISVYNLMGQKITELYSGFQSEGSHVLSWNGSVSGGAQCNTGIYVYRMIVKNNTNRQLFTRKMIKR